MCLASTVCNIILVSTSKNWSGDKSSSPSFELSFSGDELWVISDARSPSMLGKDFIRNNPKFISTKSKFKWWRWTFVSTSIFRGRDNDICMIWSIWLRLWALQILLLFNHFNNSNNYFKWSGCKTRYWIIN